ncbi:DmsC/YnfH family molybdoenzyme membrane anchor subunit [Eggerthella timonensis]|uniref:DmsC/YnfH family molybdoenzyme membrane anchor subunit n=1 Tax=Eggerthella timonensis TaxID=1871008 RepID=UPI000C77B1EF|nr:DmsC/YnfH family molybdoenzyme membrane anchor subunit [Eggerthella timonensis]
MLAEMLPLLVFTTFAGLAAGAYAIDALCGNGRTGSCAAESARPWLFPLVCLALLGLGLCGTLLHLGQPLRFVNGMANPGSMIAQEAYWSIAFGLVIVADLALAKVKGASVRPVRWVGGLVAVGLMVVTGLAYYQSLGLPAWSGAATVPLFLVGDLALGAGLCALLDRSALANGILAAANVAAGVAFAAVLCAFGLYVARVGHDATGLLVAAGIVGPLAASAAAVATRAGKLPAQAGAVAVCVLATAGVVIARYAFFAAGMM